MTVPSSVHGGLPDDQPTVELPDLNQMIDCKFRPAELGTSSEHEIRQFLCGPGIAPVDRGQAYYASGCRWEISLSVRAVDVPGLIVRAQRLGVGRLKLSGASYDDPTRLVDRRIIRRLGTNQPLLPYDGVVGSAPIH